MYGRRHAVAQLVHGLWRQWRLLLLLLLLLLTSCGKPLQLSPTTRPTGTLRQTSAPTHGVTQPTFAESNQRPTVGMISPEPSTIVSTSVPEVVPSALPTSQVVIIPQTVQPQSYQERWQNQQLDRQSFDPARSYHVVRPVSLRWYDPVTGQHVEVGTLLGAIPVTAQFVLRDTHQLAFEVPYRINVDFGLTAISDALKARMQAAGYLESVDAYVLESDALELALSTPHG